MSDTITIACVLSLPTVFLQVMNVMFQVEANKVLAVHGPVHNSTRSGEAHQEQAQRRAQDGICRHGSGTAELRI